MTDASPHHEIARRLLHGRVAASTPVVAPDGRRIAFVVSTVDVDANRTETCVWLAGPDGEPAPVTAGPYDAAPAWSPDGRHLLFRSMQDDEDTTKPAVTRLRVMPTDGPGETRTVCVMAGGVESASFSPDGRWIAFTSRTRDARYDAKDERWQAPRKVETFFGALDNVGWVFDRPKHVYVVAAHGTGPPRNLTPGPYQHAGAAWLTDSSGVVAAAARHEGWDRDRAEDLYVVSLDGEIRPLTQRTGVYGNPAVSPDGRHVAFLGSDDPMTHPQNVRVGVVALSGGEHRWISTGLDRTFQPSAGTRPPVWLDADTLIASAEDAGETHLYRLDAAGGRDPEALTTGPITVGSFDAAGGGIAFAASTVEHPSEIHTLDGPVTDLTTSELGWERFSVPTTDGTGAIDAWIMRPDGFDPERAYPVLLNVHGGPFTQYGETFFDEAQMQAAAGFVVVMSNPRGGSGRHTAWGQAIIGPTHPTAPGTGWGSVDVDDVMAVLDAALDRYPFCDGQRVGMLGGSYGGYMATMLAGRFSDRFGAICSERAVNNLTSLEWESDIATLFRAEHGPSHLEDPDLYVRMSPIRYVRDIDVPMLLLHSENDLRCPIGQAEELWVALRLLGKDVTFYRFPGEGHELTRSGSPLHRVQRAEIILDWFTEHLGPGIKGDDC